MNTRANSPELSKSPERDNSLERNESQFRRALCSAQANLTPQDQLKCAAIFAKYGDSIETVSAELFSKLNKQDQSTFVQWFLRRWGQVSIVSDADLAAYNANVEQFTKEAKQDVEFNGKPLKQVNCGSQGYDFELTQYDWVCGVHDIFYNQYEHGTVVCEPGDVIIDAGAFIGDTACLFNYKTKGDCTLHCFELLDDNIELLHHNAKQNQITKERYTVNKRALSDKSGDTFMIDTTGHQGMTRVNKDSSSQGEAIETISIDDYVKQQNLTKLDFIKMDIEGAERATLKGAKETIQRFKPKLAVCIYHLWDDPIVIPKVINEMVPDYHFYFKWVHLKTGWEAVLLADARDHEQLENTQQAVSFKDFSLNKDNSSQTISALNTQLHYLNQSRQNLIQRYRRGNFLKKTFIYDWYLKLKGRPPFEE